MKKKMAVLFGLVMGIVILFSAAPTKAEATCIPTIRGSNVEMVSVRKHTRLCLKGEVKVTDQNPVAYRKAKIFVDYQGTRYKDCCAKFLRTKVLVDYKGAPTGFYEHVYTFTGCKTCF